MNEGGRSAREARSSSPLVPPHGVSGRSPDTPSPARPGRILIIEDERAIAETLAYALAREGFEPEVRERGGEGLALLREGGWALAVLDVGLPDQSGFDVCRRLRTFSDLPVLFLTARSDEVDRIVGLELGADDYVAKPFSPREVVARIRAILRRTGASGGTADRPGAGPSGPSGPDGPSGVSGSAGPLFAVAPEAHLIRYCGAPLDLTRYEFRLLETLLAHPGRVFTRAQLMDRVWSGAEDTADRTVDTHVKTLRAKLRAVRGDLDPILTHRGLGYSIGAAPCA
jgi:two-component system, OmpR family, catabolic regulation response regulator CreB